MISTVAKILADFGLKIAAGVAPIVVRRFYKPGESHGANTQRKEFANLAPDHVVFIRRNLCG